jgi:uncharacterized protein YjbI with pentapeptide repeats
MDLRVVDLLALELLAADFPAADFRAADFRAADFRVADFRVADFRVAALPVFRFPVRFECFAAFDRRPAFFFGAMRSSGLWVGRTPRSDLSGAIISRPAHHHASATRKPP